MEVVNVDNGISSRIDFHHVGIVGLGRGVHL